MNNSMVVLAPEQLIQLLHGAGGGMAAGNSALAASLGAQSQTIAAQTLQIKNLLEENLALTRRIGELERAQFAERQWQDKVSLTRESMERASAHQAEMMGIVKAAASGVVAQLGGGSLMPQVLGTLLSSGSIGAVTAPTTKDTTKDATTGNGAPAEASASNAPLGPLSSGELLRTIVKRLRPETIDAILKSAEAPHPDAANKMPTLVAMLQLLMSVVPHEVLGRIREEIGDELWAQALAAVMPGAGR